MTTGDSSTTTSSTPPATSSSSASSTTPASAPTPTATAPLASRGRHRPRPSPSRAGTAGAYADPTGLYALGHRYYDPSLGRFTQPDPSGQETNRNLYAGGDPIDNTDLSGLSLTGFASSAMKKVGVASAVTA
ncbi:RHS repeat-associated core domain-containing protein [Streptomyces sp. NPDC057363]|uniref:RHS repeat-associated core domain-containing protein n=1 Tax=Streptomyces sp. NPDC057363 TaxID=3346107 RepID=UPI0036456D50